MRVPFTRTFIHAVADRHLPHTSRRVERVAERERRGRRRERLKSVPTPSRRVPIIDGQVQNGDRLASEPAKR